MEPHTLIPSRDARPTDSVNIILIIAICAVAQNAMLLLRGDLVSHSVRYLHHCEGVRSDVRVIDIKLLTLPW